MPLFFVSLTLSSVNIFRGFLTLNQRFASSTSVAVVGTMESEQSKASCSTHYIHVNGIPTKVIKVDGQPSIGDGGVRECMQRYTSNVIFLIIPGEKHHNQWHSLDMTWSSRMSRIREYWFLDIQLLYGKIFLLYLIGLWFSRTL